MARPSHKKWRRSFEEKEEDDDDSEQISRTETCSVPRADADEARQLRQRGLFRVTRTMWCSD